MNDKSSKFLEGPIIKSLISLAIPIILANILQTAYQLTDAFWVGRLGGTAVAAVSVSFPIIFLLISLGSGFAIAGSILTAQYFGAKNKEMVNHVAGQTFFMVIVSSLILGSIGYILAPTILKLMNVEWDVFTSALGFMRVIFMGIIFMFGFVMFQSIMRGIGEVKMPMFIILATVLLNFVLDPLFIFGWGNVPGYGVMGAAMSTFGTQAIAIIIGLIVLSKGKYYVKLKLLEFRPDYKFIKKAFLLGFPSSIEQSSRALGFIIMTFLIASFGTLTIAAYGVGGNILQLVIIPSIGLSMAISVLVGQNIGAGNIKRASDIAKLGTIISFVGLTIIGIIIFIFAKWLIAFFIPNDQEVIAMGTDFIKIMALSFGFIGIQMSLTAVLRASGNTFAAMMIVLLSQILLQFPLAYFLSKHTALDIDGLWWAFPISNVLAALITIMWYRRGDWKNKNLINQNELAKT